MRSKSTKPKLTLRRLLIFSDDVVRLAGWYERVLGLKALEVGEGWADLEAGGCNLSIHHTSRKRSGDCGHKLVFAAKNVASTRKVLVGKGAKLGAIKRFGSLHLCDGRDPDGNVLQLSNRP